jgi:hypothetical protein
MPPNVLPWEFINDDNNKTDISRYRHHRNSKYDNEDDDSDLSSEIEQHFTSSKQFINDNIHNDGKRLWEKLLKKEQVVAEEEEEEEEEDTTPQQKELIKALSSIVVLDDDDDDDSEHNNNFQKNKDWLNRFQGQSSGVSLKLIEGLRYVCYFQHEILTCLYSVRVMKILSLRLIIFFLLFFLFPSHSDNVHQNNSMHVLQILMIICIIRCKKIEDSIILIWMVIVMMEYKHWNHF